MAKKKWDEVKDKVVGGKKALKPTEPPKKHTVVGTTVGGIKQRPSTARPESNSVFYKGGTRGGNRNKSLD